MAAFSLRPIFAMLDRLVALVLAAGLLPGSGAGQAQVPDREFFEARIRPVLVERCYRCHNSSGKREAGLALDSREALRRGGRSGPPFTVGRSAGSLLLRALRHEGRLRMPKGEPKLGADVVRDFAAWIDGGAVDPRDRPPTAADLAATQAWENVRAKRADWWSFRPVRAPEVPAVDGSVEHPVDRFLRARMAGRGVAPAPRASRRDVLRRVSFALTGLPPTPEEMRAFLASDDPQEFERVVDRLLASERFGERWARHWMDWMRYAESHGSEGDPRIPNAYRYRDYLIRALNRDLPVDQLIREHVAGDLLPQPRLDGTGTRSESAIGAAQLRFVQHGFAPTDALEEQVRFVDNQIDVVSKAFLGMTVSCARCHHHKFDPIGQDDYYAWYGIFASGRPGMVTLDRPARQARRTRALAAAKRRVRAQLARAWRAAVPGLVAALREPRTKAQRASLKRAEKDPASPLGPWLAMRGGAGTARIRAWEALARRYEESLGRTSSPPWTGWDLAAPADYSRWVRHGVGVPDRPQAAGSFAVLPEGDRILDGLLPEGAYTHLASSKHSGHLSSPWFAFAADRVYLRVRGDGGARVRFVVQGYPRQGTVYPLRTLNGGDERWISLDTRYWRGDQGYLELSTAADQAVECSPGTARSWFGITDAVWVTADQVKAGIVPRREPAEFQAPLWAGGVTAPGTVEELLGRYRSACTSSIDAWVAGTATDAEVRFLSFFLAEGWLPTRLTELPGLREAVDRYRRLEAEVPVPIRVPGVIEGPPRDQPLMIRGNHKATGAPVPRGFLAALNPRPYPPRKSGRPFLAADLVRPDNPLTPRVMVNRIWHHLFGTGLVATPDNFGRLGAKPSHPELLDYLATRFVASGWSTKRMVRLLVTSEAFRATSRGEGGDGAGEARLWARFPVRRLDAESIRDALFAASGELRAELFGAPVGVTAPRRSVYVAVVRNRLAPFLRAFDAPEPHTTRGRRDVTNVPAQALAMVNGALVRDRAQALARRVLADRELATDAARLGRIFDRVFQRPPSPREVRRFAALRTGLVDADEALHARRRVVDAVIDDLTRRIAAREEPVRKALREQRALGAAPTAGPEALASWNFATGLRDRLGRLHGRLRGDAKLEGGALVLGGRGHVETAPLDRALRAKSLEVWVRLEDLTQRGGGVMSVQADGGNVFDALVFGEKRAGHWLAGSDHFHRTRSIDGTAETVTGAPVHLVLTYAADGTITLYRNGKRCGAPYSAPVAEFPAGKSTVLFGLRHAPATPGRHLRGTLHRARLFDRALTAAEVQHCFAHSQGLLTRAEVRAAMTAADRSEVEAWERALEERRGERDALPSPVGYRKRPELLWREVARALFSMKEFIYLK